MQHPDEGTIHAWIDGELPAEDAAALAAHLTDCAECSALAAEARGLAAASSRIVSALDIVPGAVIPKAAARQRPWYASTQLRAAAAAVIVAGASLVVMRDRGVTKMERALQDSAPAAAPVSPRADLDSAVSKNKPAMIADAPLTVSQKIPAEKKVPEPAGSKLQKSAANDAAKIDAPQDLATPPAVAPRATADEMSAAQSVVVTGVATAATGQAELKQLRTDSSTRATVYEVSPGVEVTLFDQGPRMEFSRRTSVSAQSRERQAAAPQAAPPSMQPAPKSEVLSGRVTGVMPKAATINSISWTDKRGHLMVMSGPLSMEELEGIRKRLPPDRR